jgi:ADP-ribosylglycohydrolase
MLGAIAGDIIGSVYEGKVAWQSAMTPHFIRDYIERKFAYRLDKSIDDLRPGFTFQVSCQATVPPAIIAFLESTDYENAIRLAVSLGGDSDTIACIAGGIAQAYYGGIPGGIRDQSLARLDDRLRAVVDEFERRFTGSSVGSM